MTHPTFAFSDYTNRLYNSPVRHIHSIRARHVVDIVGNNASLFTGKRVLELGCSDLYFLTRFAGVGFRPKEYVGVDIFWEDTEEQAQHNAKILRQQHALNISLYNQPAERLMPQGGFDLVVALETLEHVENEELVLSNLRDATNTGGYFLFSLPVEFGVMLLAKEFARMTLKRKIQYSPTELVWAALGRTWKIRRVLGDHKGYDYRLTLERLRKRQFSPVEERLYPFSRQYFAYGYVGLWRKLA